MRAAVTLLLLLTLTACGPGLPAAATPSASPPPTETPIPTATVDWFPATATPTLFPTQAPLPEVDMHPGLGEVILSDDFSDERAWETGTLSGATIAVDINVLSIAIPGAKASVASRRAQPELRDFYLEVTAQQTLCRGSDNYGLLLRSASPSDFYRWIITCEGQMRLERITGGTVAVVQDWIPAVRRPETARLGVWFFGREMRFFIDDIYQFGVTDPVLSAGIMGVFARSDGVQPLTINYSDLTVRRIDPAAVAAAATPTPQPTASVTAASAAP